MSKYCCVFRFYSFRHKFFFKKGIYILKNCFYSLFTKFTYF